jgi:ribonuclease P protein component
VTASVPGASNQSGKPRAAGARFSRGMRLLRHADFERVYKMGRRHFSASMTVFYLARPEGQTQDARRVRGRAPATPGFRVGFTVGRALGGAVDRNRMKRRLREATRLAPPPAKVSADVVINPKKSFLATDFEAVLNEVRRAFVVIEQKLEGKVAKEKA